MPIVKLKKINKPKKGNINKDVTWLCDSLCLSSGRDTESTSMKIVLDVLENRSKQKDISSEKIADDLQLSQGLVNHHLRNLIHLGILVRKKRNIRIRGGSLKEAVREIRRDALRVFDNIEDIAEDIDSQLGIHNR